MAREWIAERQPRAIADGRLAAFARGVARGGLVADIGCGPGWYARWLGDAGLRVVALDVSPAMLTATAQRAPQARRLRADLAALPLRDQSLDAVWANASYQHAGRDGLPLALARLHWAMKSGAPVALTLTALTDRIAPTRGEHAVGEAQRRSDLAPFEGRLFTFHSAQCAGDLMRGAGFEDVVVEELPDEIWLAVRARRARSLPDLIAPRLRLLMCGLNPSLYSADRGIGFARSGNRFWRAARSAGLVEHERDPLHALARGIGMTDIVKRATSGSDELSREEYADGLQRLERLVRLYRPRAICFVGLEGWRKVIQRLAAPGWQPQGFGGCPAYLMPSTSGRNARVALADLVTHLRRAASR